MKKKPTQSTSPDLSAEHVKRVLFDLNDVAPDTLDGGAYSGWKFTALEKKGDEWTLRYTNNGHPKGDFVRFKHAGPCVVDGHPSKKWEDAAFDALNLENRSDEDMADDF